LAYTYWLADIMSLEELAAWMLLLLSVTVVLVVVTTIDLALFRASSLPAVVAGVTTCVGVVAAGLQGLGLLVLSSFDLDAHLVLGTGLCAAAACCAALRGGGLSRPSRESAVSRSAVDLARADLRRLQYQRSSSSGWTTGVKMGASGTIPFEASEQATRSQTDVEAVLTTPEIIRLVRNLLEAIHRDLAQEVGTEEQVRVFVGIDELDKLESDSGARDFLNEIKGVFNIPGVIFLVSVSEDALAAFERRGLAFRDAFDSAFDEIVHLPQLSLLETSEILKRKVSGSLPRPFVALGHCLSGGLARDLVRTVDRMVETEAPRSLCKVTEAAIHRELRGKWQAAVSAMRPLPLEPHVTDLIKVLYQIDRCPDGRCVPERCLVRADAFQGVYDLRLPPPSDSELSHLRTLLRLSGEYLGFAYFCLTLSQFFVDVEDNERIRQIQGAEQADQHERNGLDYLARARQHLGVNPRLGWEQISYFRAAHELLPVMKFPDLLLGTVPPPMEDQAGPGAGTSVPVPPV
jgi:hypothetical protein